MTLIFGILLYISDKFSLQKKIDSDFNFKSVIMDISSDVIITV